MEYKKIVYPQITGASSSSKIETDLLNATLATVTTADGNRTVAYNHYFGLLIEGGNYYLSLYEKNTSSGVYEEVRQYALTPVLEIAFSSIQTQGDTDTYKASFKKKAAPTATLTSKVTITNPALALLSIAEVEGYKEGASSAFELDFIGSLDTRPGREIQAIFRPGKTFEVYMSGNNLVFAW